jgi:hypothetical protein
MPCRSRVRCSFNDVSFTESIRINNRYHYCIFQITGSPFNLTIIPAATSGKYSTMESATDATRNATAMEPNYLQLISRDLGNNLITEGKAVVNGSGVLVTPSTTDRSVPATNFSFSVEDLLNGKYNLNYTTNVAGTYLFTIMINGEHVQGSPFNLIVYPNVMVVNSTIVTGDGLSQGKTGVSYSIYVQGRDAWQNNLLDFQIGSQTKLFSVSLVCGNTTVLPDTVTYKGSAKFLFQYVPIKASPNCSVFVSGYSADQLAPGFPRSVVIDPGYPVPAMCTLTGPGLVGQTAGLTVDFTLTAYVNSC